MCYSGRRPSQKTLHEVLSDRYSVPESLWKDAEDITAFDYAELPIVTNEQPTIVQPAQWGLIPSWVRDGDTAKRMADSCRNAMAEAMFEKPAFREAARHRRCLIFLEGFYEWQHAGKKKIKHFIRRKQSSITCIGGLWSDWHDAQTGTTWRTCVLITTEANSLMSVIHNNKRRQPLILPEIVWADWLRMDTTENELKALCAVYNEDDLSAVPWEKPELPEPGMLF